MNTKHFILTVIFLAGLAIVFAFPSLEISGGNIVKCHFLDCPQETSICERNTTTLETPNVIRTTVFCKDVHGNLLKNESNDVPNDKKGYKTNVYTFRLNYSKSNKQIQNQ